MAILGTVLYLAGLLTAVVCWIMVLVKMFKDQEKGGTVQGLIGLFCGPWAFIWGWINVDRVGKNLMLAFTGGYAGIFIGAIIGGMGAASQVQ